jgi:hypothetical protein
MGSDTGCLSKHRKTWTEKKPKEDAVLRSEILLYVVPIHIHTTQPHKWGTQERLRPYMQGACIPTIILDFVVTVSGML